MLVYCGHMFEEGCAEEGALAARIAAALDELGVGDAFGPLACGGDILVAEAVQARGGRLHVVLPFAEADFIAESVQCGGDSWLARYRRLRDAAVSVHFATPGAYVGDDNQFAYSTRFAMGLAALRAQELGVEAVQLAILSSQAASFSKTGLAGTAADVGVWARLGKRTVVVDPGPVSRALRFPPRQPPAYDAEREVRSILFADYKGFSALGERELPLFMREVMGGIGQVLDDFGAHIEFRNTWGDAIYVIVDQPTTAARVALALQDRLKNLPPALTPAGGAGMRVGLHYGPIYVGRDRVTHAPLWYGGEVNRTARIEPITPAGGVLCTDTFAAALLIDGCSDCVFTSIGRQALAKDYGTVELFRLDHGQA
ncbi:MAG: adenylate/guanylate cyclase domain-containing protein [Novosphingobium sp.]